MADISRADALALLATQELDSIIKPETSGSAALAAFRSIRMSAGTGGRGSSSAPCWSSMRWRRTTSHTWPTS